MKVEGGCYCKALRYEVAAEPRLRAQCHCRECQYFSGGGPNYYMLLPPEGFRYVAGTPATFARSDLPQPVTREFCGGCGTHIATRRLDMPWLILKVGTLDEPARFEAPTMAIYTIDRQPFHLVPDGLPTFERLPTR